MKPNFIIGRTCKLEEADLNQIDQLLRRLSFSKDESFRSRQNKINHLLEQIKSIVSDAFAAGLKEGWKMGVDAEQEGRGE